MRHLNIDTAVPNDLVEAIRKLKRLPADKKAALVKNLSDAYGRVYRAVALDIDGTFVDENGTLSGDLVTTVITQLRAGVPILFFTGRGKASSREIGNSIRAAAIVQGLSPWYLRRLQMVIRNGETSVYTRTSEPTRFLEYEQLLIEEDAGKKSNLATLNALLKEQNYNPQLKENSLRLVNVDHAEIRRSAIIINQCKTYKINIQYSKYRDQPIVDFTLTNKGEALEAIAKQLGLRTEEILCIGDQGSEGGNDFEFLSRNNGFSVGEYSESEVGCFPVLDTCNAPKSGPSGTATLLLNVLVVPPVSLNGEFFAKRSSKLAGFERFARRHSLETKRTITNELRAKYRSMIPTGERFFSSHTLELSDIFDEFSGAIRLRDWELEELSAIESVDALYGIKRAWDHRMLNTERTLDTDTGMILRGATYYWSIANAEKRFIDHLPEFLRLSRSYITDSLDVVCDTPFHAPTLPKFKILISIFDNNRNVLLTLLYYFWLTYQEKKNTPEEFTACVRLLVSNCRSMARILLDQSQPFKNSITDLEGIAGETNLLISSALEKFSDSGSDIELFKYRECDYFLESFVATRSAIIDFERHGKFPDRKLQVLGIACGGIEIPILSEVICETAGISCQSLFSKWSSYSARELEKTDLNHYFQDVKRSSQNLPILSERPVDKSLPILIADDNCTTCRTIQHVRDTLVYAKFSVAGAIIVRYPGTNRLFHMAKTNHGFPDPENLYGFVRGLVSPSPYTRLSIQDLDSPSGRANYEDKTGVFDKSKARIRDLLVKNRVIDPSGGMKG